MGDAISAEIQDYYSWPSLTGPAPPDTDVEWIIGGVLQRLFPDLKAKSPQGEQAEGIADTKT